MRPAHGQSDEKEKRGLKPKKNLQRLAQALSISPELQHFFCVSLSSHNIYICHPYLQTSSSDLFPSSPQHLVQSVAILTQIHATEHHLVSSCPLPRSPSPSPPAHRWHCHRIPPSATSATTPKSVMAHRPSSDTRDHHNISSHCGTNHMGLKKVVHAMRPSIERLSTPRVREGLTDPPRARGKGGRDGVRSARGEKPKGLASGHAPIEKYPLSSESSMNPFQKMFEQR